IELVLMIPRADCDGIQRQVMTHAASFDDALEVIYETIGCAEVAKKPVLMYKISNAGVKALPISLSTDEDWTGCLAEVRAASKKALHVQIVVTEQYLLSLRAKLGIKGTAPATKSKKKVPLLDLEHAQSDEDDFDEGLGIMETEKKFLEQLQAKLGRCQRCGPTKSCKIDISGAHFNLRNNQLLAWSHSLAVGTRGVTLETPPNATAFGMFFKNSNTTPRAVETAGQPPFQPFPPYMGMNPYAMMPWGAMPAPQLQPSTPITPSPAVPAVVASGTRLAPAFPSSDPPDMGAVNPYPEIDEFLHQLDGFAPKRRLLSCIQNFEDLDFFNIDEIAKLQTPQELVKVAGLTLGNATYIMEQVKGKMKRIDRERKDRMSAV
ncbi:hypothetical protein B0H15DRAFT_770820, partial [Mycena belliarum]